MAASAPIFELTVTCNQCGSASLDRLDRREYRCRHCGAITVLSENDADRIERLLRDALAKQQKMFASQVQDPGVYGQPPFSLPRVRVAVIVIVAGFAIALIILLSTVRPGQNSGGGAVPYHSSFSYVAPKDIPLNQVTLSPLQWIGDKDGMIPGGRYHALLYNHSGLPIDVPDFGMTFFSDGLKAGTAFFSHDVSHLLPGEYTHVTFQMLDSKLVRARYEVEPPATIRECQEELVRLPVEQAQMVKQEGTDEYRFIGLVRNTYKRPLLYAAIGVVLYGPDNQLLGGGEGTVSSLRPGEKASFEASISVDKNAPQLRSYEYLVDATLERPAQ